MDGIVESLSLASPEVTIIFFTSVANHIEVATEEPRHLVRGSDVEKRVQEVDAQRWGCGSVDVGDNKGQVGESGLQVHRKGVICGRPRRAGEVPRRPRGEDPTRRALSIDNKVGVKRARKEGTGFENVGIRKFSLLQESYVGGRTQGAQRARHCT